jgi:hypothetical protein
MFWKRQPPPPPIYKKRPIATFAVILSFVGMFVLGPIGAIYNGLTEELKTKANNETILLYMKQQKENDDRQWKEIERNRQQQVQVMQPPQTVRIQPAAVPPNVIQKPKLILTPEQFEKILKLKPEIRTIYKKYLESKGFDVSGIPD